MHTGKHRVGKLTAKTAKEGIAKVAKLLVTSSGLKLVPFNAKYTYESVSEFIGVFKCCMSLSV